MSTDRIWKKIIIENLGYSIGERLLIISDKEIEIPIPAELPVSAEICVAPSSGGHGMEPALEVWEAAFGAASAVLEFNGVFEKIISKKLDSIGESFLDNWISKAAPLAPNAVIAITHFSTSHTLFRKLLNRAGTRYASIPLFEPYLLRENGPIDIDYLQLEDRCRKLYNKINGAKKIKITAPNGTDLELEVEGRQFHIDDGNLTKKGSFGNLPAGEIYIAPLEGRSNGTLVIEDGSEIHVEDGAVVEIFGESKLSRIFSEHSDWLKIAELGIGMNDRANRTDNVLEAEKILSTVHIAFGDNSGFGGTQRIPYHVDHVVFNPTLIADSIYL